MIREFTNTEIDDVARQIRESQRVSFLEEQKNFASQVRRVEATFGFTFWHSSASTVCIEAMYRLMLEEQDELRSILKRALNNDNDSWKEEAREILQ